MTLKKRNVGEKYRPVATVMKRKNGVPTVLKIGKLRYVLDASSK